MKLINSIKIISGGQTGVDRAALDLALEKGIPCGGYCPKGRKAEDGIINLYYPLKETTSKMYSSRTIRNVSESDGTMILHLKDIDSGTNLTHKLCKELHKPLWIQNLIEPFDQEIIIKWIVSNKIRILNFAGPRESYTPGIYKHSKEFIERLFL